MEKKKMIKTKTGVVTSDKMDKTVVVAVKRRVQHPMYKKYITKEKSFFAHDEKNACQVGDTVVIEETRPLSAKKRWRVVKIEQKTKEQVRAGE